ncbi:MAG: diacylglycerol kinase family lipid kinase [Bacteroidales bacterium]|nr:diacylglycerol kinase family lipid kinase [Bacteroidales bacterium]
MNSRKKSNWIAIVNRTAGGGKTERDWPVINQLLEKHGIRFEPCFTNRRLHASIIARNKIDEGYSKIIIVGGDGTMNEVINGVFAQNRIHTTEVMLGMISVGTGNDWARMFNIPADYEKAILTIKQQKTFIQDAGLVNYRKNDKEWKRYFINIAGMGFGARVVERSNRMKDKGKSGPLLYFYNIFFSLIRYRALNAEIDIDGKTIDRSIFSMNVGICMYNGGGMMPVPHAIADDGLYSITLIKKIGKLNVLANMKRLYNGSIIMHSKVETYTARSVQIDGPARLQIETDGESLGHGPMRFQIIPKSVRVISGELSA